MRELQNDREQRCAQNTYTLTDSLECHVIAQLTTNVLTFPHSQFSLINVVINVVEFTTLFSGNGLGWMGLDHSVGEGVV